MLYIIDQFGKYPVICFFNDKEQYDKWATAKAKGEKFSPALSMGVRKAKLAVAGMAALQQFVAQHDKPAVTQPVQQPAPQPQLQGGPIRI